MPVKLETDDLTFEHPDTGATPYSVADPIDFMLSLTRDGLLDANGAAIQTPEALEKLKARTCEAFKFPTLTYRQLIQIVGALCAYVESLQKKTPSMPNLPPVTGSSPTSPPNA